MNFTIAGMLATTFAYVSETVDLQVSTAGAPLVATVPSIAAARVHLATSAADLVRAMVAAFNAAPGLPGGVTFAASLGTDGRITITCTGDTWKSADLHTKTVGLILGYSAPAVPYAASQTATLQPMHVVYWISLAQNHRRSRRAGGYSETQGGVVYGWSASSTSHERMLRCEFIPRTPTIATAQSTPATPLEPLDTYRDAYGSTATGRAWSWQDAAKVAPGSLVAFTNDFPTLRTSTTEAYDLGYLDPKLLLGIEDAQLDPTWDCYHSLDWRLVLPTSGSTGTRA